MEDEKFDVIIVGGGVAGLSAAMVAARSDLKFLLVERGEFFGAKNVSGGVLWGTDLAELVPSYWEDDRSFERYIRHRRLTFMDEGSAFSIDFKSNHFDALPYKGIVVLRGRFDQWLADKVQEAIDESAHADASFLATDVLVDEILTEDGKTTGIRTGDDAFLSDCIIIAEGVNNLLTRQIGLQTEYVASDGFATGVKEIIRLDRNTLENRFQLDEKSGLSNEFLGFATQGVEGGGFLYTNRDTISLGIVASIADLKEKQRAPYDVLTAFKNHPVVADMIRGGEVVEYSAHVVSTGDMTVMPRDIVSDGVLIAGEAANLVLNSGKAIQGMDFAMRSGILAAESVARARENGDFSAAGLSSYKRDLETSYVMQDLRNFQDAVKFLHSEEMFTTVPDLMCDFGRRYFTIENKPALRVRKMFSDAVKEHSSYWKMLQLGRKAFRSL